MAPASQSNLLWPADPLPADLLPLTCCATLLQASIRALEAGAGRERHGEGAPFLKQNLSTFTALSMPKLLRKCRSAESDLQPSSSLGMEQCIHGVNQLNSKKK